VTACFAPDRPLNRSTLTSLNEQEFAIEISYEGVYEIDEEGLADGSALDKHFGSLGGWIASTLVKAGDLGLDHTVPDEEFGA